MNDFLIIMMLSSIVSGLLTSVVAQLKNYSGPLWFLLGFVFPVIAPVVIIFFKETLTAENAPPSPKTHIKCPDCTELVRKEANVCKHCGCKLVPVVENKIRPKEIAATKQMKKCGKCGTTNDAENIECWKCSENF